jgi:hypothetical protein
VSAETSQNEQILNVPSSPGPRTSTAADPFPDDLCAATTDLNNVRRGTY